MDEDLLLYQSIYTRMKKVLPVVLMVLITGGLITTLNTKIGPVPPLGKFLNPVTGFWKNAATKDINYNPMLSIEGLTDSVKVVYDSLLIPHVFAKNDYDLYFTQGFITARHRLWQMEFQTHFAAGRLSEVFGDNPNILHIDRKHRRLGLTFGAKRALAVMEENPEAKNAIEAFSRGINAFIAQLDPKDLPLEYKIFDYQPEAWSPLKTMLLLKYMANNLAGGDHDLESTNSLALLGEALYGQLFPDRDFGIDPIIPSQTQWDFTPKQVGVDSGFFVRAITNNILSQPHPDNGSNNWAVSGKKTANGSTILAGDPHLGLNLPSIWFVMQLNAPGINVMGATLPGATGVIVGFNDSIAWSPTNARRDVRDWYKIKFKSSDQEAYWYDNEWRPTEKIVEAIKIRGAKAFYDTITYTHHGPVVYDDSFQSDQDQQNYALRWIAHDPSQETVSFYKLNRAGNFEDFQEAMSYFICPAQNFAFASANGDIGIQVQGKFPLKWEGQGKFLMDGSRKENDWQGFIPQDHIAKVLNPGRGFVSSANQFPVDSTYPYFSYDVNYEHYRNRVINRSLAQMNDITAQDMMQLQNNNFNMKAAESLPVMLKNIPTSVLSSSELALLDNLKTWDYHNNANESAPIIYKIWWNKFFYTLWDEFEDEHNKYRYPGTPQTIFLINNHLESEFYDIKSTPETEDLATILLQSFNQTSSSIDKWKTANPEASFNWWTYKKTSVNHLIPALQAFSFKNLKIGGGRNIVNATSGRHGPSWKMVVELGSVIKAWGVYPGGQSGNPGSPYYSNFINTWQEGNHYQLLFLQAMNDNNKMIISSQTLAPSKP